MFEGFKQQLADMVPPGSRVLDLGCGEGNLLRYLMTEKKVQGVGIDILEENIVSCIRQGLSALKGNIDEGLSEYADASFDVVILSQTLQVVQKPDLVLREMVRVGRKAIVSVPNFGHWPLRLQLFLNGRMPKNETLGYEWHNTPNIHLASIKDVQSLCRELGISVDECIFYTSRHTPLPALLYPFGNALAEIAIFALSKD